MEKNNKKNEIEEDIIKFFENNDYFATKLVGIKIDEVRENYAKCSLEVTEKHLNAGGHIMGGVLFTLADLAFALVCNNEHPGTLTLSSQMYYFKTVKNGRIYAEAQKIRQGGKIGVYEVYIYDESGNKIAYTTCEGFTLSEAQLERFNNE